MTSSVKNTAENKSGTSSQKTVLIRPGKNVRPNVTWLIALALLLYTSISPAAQNCPTDKIDQTGIVKRVFDGDTLQLANGDKIRMVGVNTPEMNYDKKKPEPYATEARKFLSGQALNQRVNLRFAAEKTDKYGRKLAHVFLSDGTNLQAELIRNGLAFNIAIPPNLWQTNCYLALEKQAKEKQIGIWKNKRFKPIDAKDVNQQTLGFYQVKGTIRKFKETKKSIWLELTDNMSLRISKEDKSYFPKLSEKFWLGKSVIGKGWISQKGKQYSMRIKHQSSVEIQ